MNERRSGAPPAACEGTGLRAAMFMRLLCRVVVPRSACITLLALALTALIGNLMPVGASGPTGPTTQQPLQGDHYLDQGPVQLPMYKTSPLYLPASLPNLVPALVSTNNVCLVHNVDLKILVIAADGNEAALPAIQQALDYLGTPYTVYRAAATPGGLTADKLASGCHGYYQGVIL